MRLFTQKYLKTPIVVLVIVSLLLQFVPAPKPAQAGIWDFVKNLFVKITTPPEIALEKDGYVKFQNLGTLSLIFGDFSICAKCVKKNDETKSCSEERLSNLACIRNDCKCINPLCGLKLGKGDPEDKVKLAGEDDENIQKKLKKEDEDEQKPIVWPEIPEVCELKIPRPGKSLPSEEERLAQRNACTYFIRLQRSAAQEAYLAKKMYYNTNPLDDCLFVKNCRSSCKLRFGEIKYLITLMDIAEFLLPTGWLSAIKKIMNIVGALGEIKKIYETVKNILQDGIDLVNTLLSTFNYLVNLFRALENLGGTLTASILGPVVASAAGEPRQTGPPTGLGKMKELLSRFSDNLLNFTQAKAEAGNLILGIRQDVVNVMEAGGNSCWPVGSQEECQGGQYSSAGSAGGKCCLSFPGLKKEPEISFLFGPKDPASQGKKTNLTKMLGEYQSSFKTVKSLIARLAMVGQLTVGDPVAKRGYPSEGGEWESYSGATDPPVEVYTEPTGIALKQFVLRLDVDCSWPAVGIGPGLCLFPKEGDEKEEYKNYRAIPRSATYNPGAELSSLVDPIYIESVIRDALYRAGGGLQEYLNNNKGDWREYWERLAEACQGADWVNEQKEKLETQRGEHLTMLGACTTDKNGEAREDWVCQSGIRNLDSDYREKAGTGKLKITEAIIAQKIEEYKNCSPKLNLSQGVANVTKPWLDTFKDITKDADYLRTIFDLLDPDKIEKVIDDALDYNEETGGFEYEKLDYNKDPWRVYWEDIFKEIKGWSCLGCLVDKECYYKDLHCKKFSERIRESKCCTTKGQECCYREMKERHSYVTNTVLETFPMLEPIKRLENYDDLTPELIPGYIAEYKEKLKQNLDTDLINKIEALRANIEAVVQQKKDLQQNYSQKPSIYWQTVAWCSRFLTKDSCEMGGGGMDQFPKAKDKFNPSYKPDIIDNNWDKRIELAEISKADVEAIKEALSFGITPQDLIIVYTIRKATTTLTEAVNKAYREVDEIIKDRSQTCCAYDYYKNQEETFRTNESWHEQDCGTAWHPQCCREWKWDQDTQQSICVGETKHCCKNVSDCESKKNSAWPACLADTLEERSKQETSLLELFQEWYQRFGGETEEALQFREGLKLLGDIQTLFRALQVVWESDLKNSFGELEEVLKGLVHCYKVGDWSWCDEWERNYLVNELKNIWQSVERAKSTTEAEIAQEQAASIISTKLVSGKIAEKTSNLRKQFFEIERWYCVNCKEPTSCTWEELAKKCGNWEKDWEREIIKMPDPEKLQENIAGLNISQQLKNRLKDIVEPDFEIAYNRMKDEVIAEIQNKVGEYKIGIWAAQGADLGEFPLEHLCPSDIDQLGFLNRIACFEKKNNKTFEQLAPALDAVRNLEQTLFFLSDANAEADATSSVKENLDKLEPMIRMDVLQVNTGLISDLETKATGYLKKLITGKDQEEVDANVFGQDGPKSWDDFKNDIRQNPLSFLDEAFSNITEKLKIITDKLEKSQQKSSQFFGWNSVREQAYRNASQDIHAGWQGSRLVKLQLSVFGNEELRGTCEALFPLLGLPVGDAEKTCRKKPEGERNYDLVPEDGFVDVDLERQCKDWLEYEGEIDNKNELLKELDDLRAQRMCVTKENCSDRSKPCLVCPMWFCLDPGTRQHGAGAMQKDPYCIEKCQNWQPGQNTGYVCDFTNNIVWDTAVHGAPVSSNPSQEVCDNLGFNAGCTKAQVNTRCQLFENVDCGLFTQCSAEELQKQLDIQKWRQQSKDNQCPKWFCLNSQGNWQGAAGVASDAYCQAHCGANEKPNDGMFCKTNTGIIWDTNNNPTTETQKWPPEGVSDNKANQMVEKCIEAQKGLQDLGVLDSPTTSQPGVDCSPLQPVLPFCQHKITCEKMKNGCSAWNVQQQQSALDKPPMQWPPDTRCPGESGFSQKHQGAKLVCIDTQQRMKFLEGLKELLNQGKNIADEMARLSDQCSEFEHQKDLKAECQKFLIAKKAVQDKCADSSDDEYKPNDEYRYGCSFRKTCTYKEECKDVRKNAENKLCGWQDGRQGVNCSTLWGGTSFPDLTESNASSTEALAKTKELCYEVQDIKTPLNEVMKVLSVLIGIRSGTLAFGGVKSAIKGGKDLLTNIQKLIKMIEKLLDGMQPEQKKNIQGGLKIGLPQCISQPAESYDCKSGLTRTGPKGGPVCPEVGGLFQQIQGQFSQIRQNMHQIDMAQKRMEEVDIPLPIGSNKYIKLFDAYETQDYPVVKCLYDKAAELKEKSQYLWALSTAIDYANKECTCGQSYCKFPFCVSGLPLTLAPLKEPNCALVWILRRPLNGLADWLEGELQKPIKCP